MGSWMKILSGVGLMKSILLSPLMFGLGAISLPMSLTLLAVSRSLTFLEHAGELQSDKFATKYGYGEEIARMLNKFRIESTLQNKKFLKKVYNIIKHFFFPKTHPSDSKRICKIINNMREEYKSMYPKLKNDLTIMLSDLKCDVKMTKIKHAIGI